MDTESEASFREDDDRIVTARERVEQAEGRDPAERLAALEEAHALLEAELESSSE